MPAASINPAGRALRAAEDRSPRPLEVTAASTKAAASAPSFQTIQPRPKTETSNRVVDIMDLPASNSP